MLLRLFLLFTLLPIAELALLIKIGGFIGLGPTLLLVIGTGAAGAWLARREGLRSWLAVQEELALGRIPGEELVHALFVLIAGIVLITPGVITDFIGLALLIRPVRRGLIARYRERMTARLETGQAGFVGGPGAGFFWSAGGPGPDAGGRPQPPRGGDEARPARREIIVEDETPESDPARLGNG